MKINGSGDVYARYALKRINQPVTAKPRPANPIDDAIIIEAKYDRRKQQDRRKRKLKPLLDLRSGDRRKNNRLQKVDISV